jgi:hypothetical protein
LASIDWAVLCDLAFFDRQERLCLVGIVRKLPLPTLPLAIGQLMFVAHLTDIQEVEEFQVTVAVVTPRGLVTIPKSGDCVEIEIAHDYILVTLRALPITEEGMYRFQLGIGWPAADLCGHSGVGGRLTNPGQPAMKIIRGRSSSAWAPKRGR